MSDLMGGSEASKQLLQECVRAMDSDSLRRLLFFVTGNSIRSLTLSALPKLIWVLNPAIYHPSILIAGSPTLPTQKRIRMRIIEHSGALPTASTCSQELRVPDYGTETLLTQKLGEAIANAGAGSTRA